MEQSQPYLTARQGCRAMAIILFNHGNLTFVSATEQRVNINVQPNLTNLWNIRSISYSYGTQTMKLWSLLSNLIFSYRKSFRCQGHQDLYTIVVLCSLVAWDKEVWHQVYVLFSNVLAEGTFRFILFDGCARWNANERKLVVSNSIREWFSAEVDLAWYDLQSCE